MPKRVNAQFIDRATGLRVDVPAEFDDAEWQTLLRFADEVDRLVQTRMIASGNSVNYSLAVSERTGVTVTTTMPPEDDVSAFLHRMRPFVLQDEETAFFRVCKILSRRFEHAQLRRVIDLQREEFSGKRFQQQIVIGSNGTVLNSDDAVMKWVNAYEYHRDRAKRAELEALHQVLPLEASRAILVSMMIDKAGAVGQIAHIIRAMERGGGAQIVVKI